MKDKKKCYELFNVNIRVNIIINKTENYLDQEDTENNAVSNIGPYIEIFV